MLSALTLSATPHIRNAEQAAKRLISADAEISAEDLHSKLDPESQIVLNQHNPPFWFPAKNLRTPMFWIAGDADNAVSESSQRKSAEHYKADYVTVPGAAHNLMMEKSQRQTIKTIHEWLESTAG
ncbi:MAG: alpha/beta hydrolase [Pseudomonadota bacterium]